MRSISRSAVIALLLAGAANTRAEVTLCSEVVPPATITQPGVYCLLKSHVVSNASPAIAIRANNVLLDLNGHRIGSGSRYHVAGTPPNTAIDVKDVQNFTIRNGTIRGFATGISVSGESSQGHLIEDMLIEGVSGFGIDTRFSNNSVFRRNRIFGLNPQPVSNPAGSGGIYAFGSGLLVQSNTIQNFKGMTHLYGMFISGESIVAEGNHISQLVGQQPGISIGISCYGVCIASSNRVIDISSSEAGSVVIGISADETAKVINNIVSGVDGVPYAGGNQIPGKNY